MTLNSLPVTFIASRSFTSKAGHPLSLVTVLDDQKKTLEFFADPKLSFAGLGFGDLIVITFDFNGKGMYLIDVSLHG